MDELYIRTEDIRPDEVLNLFVETVEDRKGDLLPMSRTSHFSKKSINPENDGHQNKQIQRRTDHPSGGPLLA